MVTSIMMSYPIALITVIMAPAIVLWWLAADGHAISKLCPRLSAAGNVKNFQLNVLDSDLGIRSADCT